MTDAHDVTDPHDVVGSTPIDERVLVLEPDQCWTRLHRARVARVAFRTAESLEVVPVNIVAEDRRIVFATSSPAVLDAVHDRRELVVEADEHDGWTAWSVVVHGTGHLPDTRTVTARRLRSMLPVPGHTVVVVEPTAVSGRLFDQAAP